MSALGAAVSPLPARSWTGLRRLLAIYRREMFAYFVSPVAYIILLVFLLANGITFHFYFRVALGNLELLLQQQYSSLTFWFLTLLIPPLITMRSFSEEHRVGTYEQLTTTGISDVTLVLAKFLASWSFFLFLWVAVFPPFLMLQSQADLDWGMITTVHVGLALISAVFTSIGIFTSTFTSNQLIAASVALVLNLFVFFCHYFRVFFDIGDEALRYFQYFSPLSHFQEDFTRGIIDFRYLVLYATVTWMFLFLAVKSLERRRWW